MTAATVKCPRCDGEGVTTDPKWSDDHLVFNIACPACEGEGWLDVEVDDEGTD